VPTASQPPVIAWQIVWDTLTWQFASKACGGHVRSFVIGSAPIPPPPPCGGVML
jgi:hypothetical protein